MKEPCAVSVLMAVYNGEQFLREAIASVLSQRFEDYELIVVDDASTDGTAEILEEFSTRYSRMRVISNRQNLGLTRSLNVGLKQARGRYIARIDADDVCREDRLNKQFFYMENRPEVTIIGGGYRIIDDQGRSLGEVKANLDHDKALWLLGFSPATFHPTYFFRRLQPDGNPVLYDERFETAQDYDLWSRLSLMGNTAVLPEVLIDYRRHDKGISILRRQEQSQNWWLISQRNLKRRLQQDQVEMLRPFLELLGYKTETDRRTTDAAVRSVRQLLEIEKDYFRDHASRRWMKQTLVALLADAVLARGGGMRKPMLMLRFFVTTLDLLPALVVAVMRRPASVRKALGRKLT